MCSDCSIRTICTINEHTSVWKRWLGRWGSNALQTSQTAQRQSLLHGVSVKFSCLQRTNGRMCVWSPTSYASRLSKEWLQALLLSYTITWCSLPTPSCVEGRGWTGFFLSPSPYEPGWEATRSHPICFCVNKVNSSLFDAEYALTNHCSSKTITWYQIRISHMYYLLYSTEATSFTIPETGTVVTNYATTGESVSPSGITVTLHNRDLWAKFHRETTEMIITKAGRYACMYDNGVSLPCCYTK